MEQRPFKATLRTVALRLKLVGADPATKKLIESPSPHPEVINEIYAKLELLVEEFGLIQRSKATSQFPFDDGRYIPCSRRAATRRLSEDSTPTLIAKATLDGSALHITVVEGNRPFEFIVTLKDATHAEIHPAGAPPNMKPIPAEKVN